MRSKSSGRPAGVRAGSRLRRLVQEKEASGGLGSQRIQPNPQVHRLTLLTPSPSRLHMCIDLFLSC